MSRKLKNMMVRIEQLKAERQAVQERIKTERIMNPAHTYVKEELVLDVRIEMLEEFLDSEMKYIAVDENDKLTLRQWFEALNMSGHDRDLYVDGLDGMAVCPPVKLTARGEEVFKRALDETWIDGGTVMWEEDGSEEKEENDGIPDVAYLAHHLLLALAGYVGEGDFEAWVITEE